MKLDRTYTLKEICEIVQCAFVGSENHKITGINEIHMVENGDIVFVDHPKYYDKALKSAATTIIINKEVDCPSGKALILSEKPFDVFNQLTTHFRPLQSPHSQENQFIHPSAQIYPNVFIGNNVKIGKNTRIYPGVCIMDNTIIGDDVIIGANTVIGHFAFYYKKKEDGYDRLHTCGGVEIESNVEIGALCTIDAGVTGITRIGKGTKLDDQVHIGHDTVIGEDCLMASGVGIAGCVKIENSVILWGQVGCASDVVIGEGVVVYAQSGISKDLEAGKTYFGSPCIEAKEKFKEMAAIRQLPELLKKF
jgi:UDP-3-O-[3-hydroxymyristoyl] glucosamine N-acyltransferase